MTFTFLFILGLALSIATRYYLASRHIRHISKHREEVPKDFANKVSLADHHKAADYTIAKLRLGLFEIALSAAILISFTLLGGLQYVHDFTLDLMGPGAYQQITLLISLSLITGIIDLPFSLYRQFGIEEKFGFNRMTIGLFFTDMVKGLALSLAIGLPLLWVVLTLMAHAGEYWWVLTWVVWVAFNVLLIWLFPTFIAPLFNKFKPLEDGPLKERIENLLKRCDFTSQGLFIMDGSKRSAHGNAYFTGMGKAKRIVFFDTLIERLNPEEIEAVLAHELGHFKRQHIRKRLIQSFALSLAVLALLGWISTKPWFYLSLGVMPDFNGYNAGLALALFSLVMPVFGFFLTPINSMGSRKHEYEADAFAAEKSSAHDLITALVKLYQDNAATLTPDPLYSSFYDSHPPAPLRIAHLQKLAD
ncbi:M48 family metallopeptidase [Polynucleobacter sp. MWH-Spelu-300-X4]|uniref:M48 family metallopeptidase n=1 Tax=Polynucleobacter sp. MWH-Spelu-300-X4 TaxID=2689109 RepID=UPI001BFED8C3|nr:M48 family metallopeptidase [Polynucleobacter sp. MWH-Spelu-300-X4]QWD80254.1 M48 family metallopeptidase [Polynucleobacter sp. MWH-Spelu-300-X4]